MPKAVLGPTPDEYRINKIQAEYLAGESGLPVEKLVDRSLLEVQEELRWLIDPELLLFRKVCGRVVKKDPLTGLTYGVPNATVHVEDTDCSLLGFFPVESPLFWLWPVFCRREEIATTRTDRCGNFCVWVPRWDIDRVLRLRRERICLPDLVKPSIRDLIDRFRLEEQPIFPPRPGPGPDPAPFELDRGALRLAAHTIGQDAAARITALADARRFGQSSAELEALLDAPAFPDSLAPPLPPDLGDRLAAGEHPMAQLLAEGAGERISASAVIGPFLRCFDVIVADWETIVDVPDITFSVTQDVDGDGDEEVIYSEGIFDVRWNAGPIPPVTLVASVNALASPVCGGPPPQECVDEPVLYGIGPMPLEAPYHDDTTGFAVRPNRPRPGGLASNVPVGPSQAPYFSWLALFACHRLPGATHYRVMYDNGSGPQPFVVPTWSATTTPGQPTPVVDFTPDAQGWYEILPANTLELPDWVLYWPSYAFANGTYEVWVECRDTAGAAVGNPSAHVHITIDNRPVTLGFGSVRWWEVSSPGTVHTLPLTCPVIRRPNAAIVVEATWSASAPYFRNAAIGLQGCASPIGRDPALTAHSFEHWYESFADNAYSSTARWVVQPTDPEGAYDLVLSGSVRSFHPTFDAGPAVDYLYDQSEGYTYRQLNIAVVNA